MGKRRGRGGHSRGPNRRTEAWSSAPPSETPLFADYYKAQKLVPEAEWDEFIKVLREPLPTTFRLTSCREVAPRLNQQIEETFVPFLTGIEYEGTPLEAPKKLEWYPGGFGWQLNVPRQAIRKQDAFKRFQHFLVHEADCGNLSRQEAVSMIPPLLLDVQPHHYVLDMCAAPGSKTVQLLEALTGGQQGVDGNGVFGSEGSARDPLETIPPGLLIANDSDAKRCHLLVHQSLHRVPGAGMMVMNHDATQLPGLRLPANLEQAQPRGKVVADDDEKMASEGERKKYKPLLYDRILADVPCSGDGTLRKNVAIWKEFTPGNGTGLHSLQLRILLRGIALLKPGGRLVYSTCSMNPVENEAVVSAALQLCPEMSILDVSSDLPKLQRRPGKTDWVVLDNKCNPAPHPDRPVENDGAEDNPDKKGHKKVWAKTLWPSGKEKELGLDKALRIYGHLQDTGAFFVCVLVKKAEDKVESTKKDAKRPVEVQQKEEEKEVKEPESKKAKSEADEEPVVEAPAIPMPEQAEVDVSKLPADVVGGTVFARKASEFKEEPYIYLDPEDEQIKLCQDFFELSPSFPLENLLVRNAAGTPLRSIYFTSSVTRSLLLCNSFQRMRLISCGVKVFSRQDSSRDGTYRCKWRIMSEGLDVLRPFMGQRRIVEGSVETLKVLMKSLTVGMDALEDEAFKARISEMEPGSCVLEVDARGGGLLFEQKLTLPFWKSKNSVNLMVEKAEKSALSLRLFGEDVTPHKPGPKARDAVVASAEPQGEAAEVEAEPVSAPASEPAAAEETEAM